MATTSDSEDENSFVGIAERKLKCKNAAGKTEVVRTAQPPSVADVRNADTTVAECPVCANPMAEALTTPCAHVFCKKCILQWLAKNPTCPLCREQCKPQQLSKKPATGRYLLRCLSCHMVSFAALPEGIRSVKCPVCEHRINLTKD